MIKSSKTKTKNQNFYILNQIKLILIIKKTKS